MILEITDIIDEAEDTKTIRFGTKSDFVFKAGQFITITKVIDGEEITRAYTISSSPTQTSFIDITFRVYWKGKLTPYLYNLKKGDKLQIDGPFGDFYLTDNEKNMTFIAGGTGIAPFISMLRYLNDNKMKPKISLLYSCRKKEDIIFGEELENLAKELNINYYLTLTRDETWNGHKGRINRAVLEKQDLSSKFFLCGPEAMTNDIKKELLNLNVPNDKIITEEW